MNVEKKSLKENMIWNSVGSFTYLFLQWLLTVVIVKLAGYTVNGQFSLAMSISNVFVVVANYSMRNYQISDAKNKYTVGTYVASRYETCAIGFISCIIFVVCNNYNVEQATIIIVYMIFRLSECLVDVFQGIQQKAERMDYIGISLLIRGILCFVIFTGVFWVTLNIVVAIVAMTIVAYLVIIIYDIPKCRMLQEILIRNTQRKINQLLVECFPLVIYLIMSNCIVTVPRYFLERFHSEDILGVYAAIATPTVIVQVAASYLFYPLMTIFTDTIVEKNQKKFYSLFIKVSFAIAIVAVVALVGCVVLGEWGLQLLFGKEILEYAYLLIPVMLCTVMNAYVWFLSALLTVMRDFKGLIISNVMASIPCVILSVILIPRFSMDGVNYVLYVSLAIEIILLLFFGTTKLRSIMTKEVD